MDKRERQNFLDAFIKAKAPAPTKQGKSVVKHDKWDQEDAERLLEEMREFAAAEDRLSDFVETGSSAFMDMYYAMVKADPQLTNRKLVRPSYLVNHKVMDEAMKLREYDEMRLYCVAPGSRVLTADLRWVDVADLLIDDELLAFDEYPVAPSGGLPYARCWRNAVVTAAGRKQLPCYDLVFDDGTKVRASSDHLWLGYKGTTLTWRTTESLTAGSNGSRIAKVLEVWDTLETRDAGYLAAALDGEGCFMQSNYANPRSKSVGRGTLTKCDLEFCQKDNPMYHEVQRALKECNISFHHKSVSPGGVHVLKIGEGGGSKAESLRFLGSVRPLRLLTNMTPELGTMNVISRPRLISKTYAGEHEVVALATSTGTLVVEGLASHNTTGDEIGSALADVAMEPELETLFDKLRKESDLAKQFEQMMQQMGAMDQEVRDIEGMMRSLEENGDPDGEAPNYQEQAGRLQEQMEQLAAQMQQIAGEIEEGLDDKSGQIRAAMKGAFNTAIDSAEQMDSLSTAWGLDPGTLQRMPPEQRIELARRLNNEKFRRIAELFGPMHRMAFAEQMRKTIHSRDEIYDIEIGNDLSRVLPIELLSIKHPVLRKDFYRRFYEGQLLQYQLRGEEKLAKGAVIVCEDGSGSMSGEREIWAKAVCLTFLQIAKSQNRSFYGLHFGGPRTLREFDFRDTSKISVEQVIDFASTFFGGGTDFHTPLARSLDILREEFDATGKVSADIVFVTDGQCGLNEKFIEEFKAEQERMQFRVYGVIIDGHPDSEPLKTICDGRVLTVKQLQSGDDLREIFRNL